MRDALIKPVVFDNDFIKKEQQNVHTTEPCEKISKFIIPATFEHFNDAESLHLNPIMDNSVDANVDVESNREFGDSATKEDRCQEKMQIIKANSPSNFSSTGKTGLKKNAYQVAQQFMRCVKLVNLDEVLHFYNGIFYKKITPIEAKRIMVEYCRTEIEELGMARYVDDALNCVNYEQKLVRNAVDINFDLITFENCNLNIKTGETFGHTPDVLTTYCIRCAYIPNANSPIVFDKFLHDITGGDAGIIQRIYEMLGYILSPDLNGKCFFLLQGCPNSGKSVLAKLIASFFDKEVCSALDVHSLHEKFAPAELSGKALCISPDLPSGFIDAKSVSKLKQFTGADYICADVKNKAHIQFYCHAKFILATNHPFHTKEFDAAFEQRIIPIPFCYSVTKEQQDPKLLEKLKAEKTAIASKSIQAYYKLRANSYHFSGDYKLNTAPCLYENSGITLDTESAIYSFLHKNYECESASGVFVSDAHIEFQGRFWQVPIGTFSQIFTNFAEKLFGAKKVRKRQLGSQNPTSFLSGIKRK